MEAINAVPPSVRRAIYKAALNCFDIDLSTGDIKPKVKDCEVISNPNTGYVLARLKYKGKIYSLPAHRLVWLKAWLRAGNHFFSSYFIHHRNENKKDNNISNLQLLSPSKHSRLHALKQKEEDK